MSKRKQISLAVALSVTAGATLSTGAQAQNTTLEEVIVTAQKREQNLQDVPVAVTAFSGAQIEKSGIKDMFQLSTIAPSLTVANNQTSTATSFGIRGIFTSSQNFGLESSVGLYVDDVYRARQGSMINNMVDMASVEVLRGPQGTLFGRNTPAGAISLSSARPDHEGSGFIEADLGNYDLLNFSGAKSFSLIDEVLAVRATGFWMERDGYVDMVNQGTVSDDAINDRDRWGARLQAEWTPSDKLTMLFIADYSEVNESCCAAGAWRNNVQADSLPPGSAPVFGSDSRIEGLGGTLMQGRDFYDYNVAASFTPVSENEDKGVSLQADWETSLFTVTSITAYREHDAFDDIDADFIDIDALVRTNDATQDQFSQELRISDSREGFSYVAGLFYYHQNLDSITDTIVGADTGGLVGLPGFAIDPFPAGDKSVNVAEQEHESYAVFGQFDYNLTDTLVATAGLRWTFEDKDLTNTFTDDASPTPAPTAPGWGFWLFDPLMPREDVDTSIDDDQITGTFKLSWYPNDTTMFYASYGTGYKSGGINTDRINPALPVLFGPEESESYEVGMKADFPEQALRLNIALHKTDTDDLQTISFQGTGFSLINAGTAEAYGGEMELQWLPTASTTLGLSYAYNNGEYANFEEGPCWVGTPFHTGQPDPGANGDGTCDRSGGEISANAENVVVVTANQDFRLSDGINAFTYAEGLWTDGRMTDVNNDPGKRDGSFFELNLRTGLYFEDYQARVTLWGRNVTDEESVSTIADAVAQPGRFNAFYKEPFTWGVNLRKDF